jgi:hypothetical protein
MNKNKPDFNSSFYLILQKFWKDRHKNLCYQTIIMQAYFVLIGIKNPYFSESEILMKLPQHDLW